MTSRERVLTALDHREPDRVPIDIGSCGPTGIHVDSYQRLLAVLGIQEDVKLWDVSMQLAQPSEAVLEVLGADVRGVRVGGSAGTPVMLGENCMRDQWGTVWSKSYGTTCYSIVEYPLADATTGDLADFPWPNGADPARVAGLREKARRLREETPYAVLGEFAGHIFERAQMIRGFERFLLDLRADPEFAEELMDRILAVEISIVSNFLEAVGPYLDVIAFKDDIGMQSGPAISPAMFRRLIKPRMQKLIEAIRAHIKSGLWESRRKRKTQEQKAG